MPSQIPMIAAVAIEARFVTIIISNSVPCTSNILCHFGNATKLRFRTGLSEA